ncbi:hypothetical protein OC834_005767 [Tilletia horrida]|nr:hypothetical protein OC834_005767 [Tilletia horrida]
MERPPFCLFSFSAGSSTLGQHSLIRKFQLIASRGFQSIELFQDDLTAFAQSDEFTRIYADAHLASPPLSPELSRAQPRALDASPTPRTSPPISSPPTYNAFGPCSDADAHREVAAAAYIGLLAHSLRIQIASLQPLRDFEGWASPTARADALRRGTSRFEVMHALRTHMLFICSNCQPAAELVAPEQYAHRAGQDLVDLAEAAQRWEPRVAKETWRKRGWMDPIEMMELTFHHHHHHHHHIQRLPPSPPVSRGSSFSVGHPLPMLMPTPNSSANLTPPRDTIALPNQDSIPTYISTSTNAPAPAPTDRQPFKIGYEALSWGTHVDVWRAAWSVVCATPAHAPIGLVLDSFNTLAREWADPCSPTGIAQPESEADERRRQSVRAMRELLLPERIFFLQIADARRCATPLAPSPNRAEPRPARMIWSRSNRLFPLETERGAFLPILDFVRAVAEIGYRGPWSVEVFSDEIHQRDEGVPAALVERGYRSLERLVAAVQAASSSSSASE